MFAMRGIAISLSIFVILYGALSLAVAFAWRRVWRWAAEFLAAHRADLLFTLRILPFAVAGAVTLIFAVPSFLLLEPRAMNEPLGSVPVALGLCGFAILLAGMWNAASALLRAVKLVSRWSNGASVIGSSSISAKDSVSVFCVSAGAPPLTAAGILRPSVWLSAAAQFVLTERELETALRHEVVHVRRRDNLRKLVLRLVAFPGMGELESAWREVSEMAADDAAVSTASEALDLAAAVIKLSRMARLQSPGELTMALVHSPAESVNARVERLIAWTEKRQVRGSGYSWGYALGAAAALVVTLTVTYSAALVQVHAATELLVR